MSLVVVVVDTNVVVAGLLTADIESPVARILDGMIAAAFPFALSVALLAEYRSVLLRPALRSLHGLSVHEIDAFLAEIARHAVVIDPQDGPRAPDPGDQMLWDLLAARADITLVTGDKALLRDAGMRARVVTPRAFVGGR